MNKHASQQESLEQEVQYSFPYHYIPEISPNEQVSLTRVLNWGLEYICYQRHIAELVLSLNPNSVLDAGCGDGYFLNQKYSQHFEGVGVDYSKKAIAHANAMRANESNFIAGDVEDVAGEFDVVLAIEVLEHIPDSDVGAFLKALFSKLRVDGTMIISVPSKVQRLIPKHYRHYDKELVFEQLKVLENYEIMNLEYIYSQSFLARMVMKFSQNRLFSLEIPALTSLAWRTVWRKHRYASANNGYHLVVSVRKTR